VAIGRERETFSGQQEGGWRNQGGLDEEGWLFGINCFKNL
jgi:hypothetical protein